MEKLSFALGVASVLVVLMSIVITWVTLKVKNLIKINENLQRYISEADRSIHNRIDKTEHNYSDEIKEIYDTFHRRIDESYRILEQRIDQNHKHVVDLHNESLRYIDSRIDKLINNPKFCLNKEKELLTD
jgi:biopolymer transport protein ExbB/TolQ